jgi:hypothetical protein
MNMNMNMNGFGRNARNSSFGNFGFQQMHQGFGISPFSSSSHSFSSTMPGSSFTSTSTCTTTGPNGIYHLIEIINVYD